MNTKKENLPETEAQSSSTESHHGHVHGPNCNHGHGHELLKPITRQAPKVGRNDPCPCGSQKKFKKCCGN